MGRSVMGVVSTRDKAEAIIADLRRIGFALPDLSIVCPAASSGLALTGTLGLLAGISALALPGSAPMLAAGPLMAALSSAAAAAAIGGIAGALIGWGLPELQARLYQDRMSRGHILLAVKVRSREDESDAATVLTYAGARDVISARDQVGARAV